MTRRDFEARLVVKAWKDTAFRQALLNNPKAIIEREADIELPERVKVEVLEETPRTLYVVLPALPESDANDQLFKHQSNEERSLAPDQTRS